MNFFLGETNMIIKKKGQNNQGGNQGGWGQQNQGWGNQQQGWGGQQQNQGWGGQQNQGWSQQWGGQQQNQGWGGQQQNQGWGGQQQNQGWGGQQQNQGWGQNDGWNTSGNNGWGQGGGWGLGILNENSQQQWGNNFNGTQWVEEQKKRNDFNIINPFQKPNINIEKFIGQQVILIEPSPTQKKLEQLKKLGRPFMDQSFPPNQVSLNGQYPRQQDWKSITWKKASEVMKNPQLFHNKVEPGDIKQGYLGDCYFLAGLAALAQRPDRIFNLFLLRQLNQQKYFSVKILYKGKWMTIDMDQHIPWLGNQPAFSRANQDELWVVILQKAWAKLYTSYKRIEAGYPEQPLHDLTGAPIKQIGLKAAGFNKQQQWQYLVDASRRQYSMVASSNPGSDTNKSVSGVVQGHAYTILNFTTINFQGRQQRIVQCRNPWGKGQFTGKWSDADPNWNYVSQQERNRIGFNPNKEDGIFFMPYDNFIAQFRALTVAEIDDNASYVYKSVKDPQCKGAFFSIQILQQGTYSFQVDKTPQRIYPQKYQQMFQYPQALIEIGKIQGNSCQRLQGLRSARRTLFKKQRLSPGKYVAFVRISYSKDFQNQFDVNLAIYAPTVCGIQIASRQQAIIFSGNPNVQWTGKQGKSNNSPWNTMGNIQSGGNNNFGNNNQGWGEQINYGGQQQNQGWAQQDKGWGGQNQGWSQGSNQGWGGNNNGWGQGGW